MILSKFLKKEEFELFAMLAYTVWHKFCKILDAPTQQPKDINVDWAKIILGWFSQCKPFVSNNASADDG